jgi:ABC-type Mn2+/Zn2+ transport system permease subunit
MWDINFIYAKSFWAAALMGMFCPIIGRHMVMGRSIMLGLALPQVSLAGVAFMFLGAAYGWGWCTYFQDDATRAFAGALLLTLPALLLLALPARRRVQLSEGWLAFVYLAAVSVTNLMLSSNAVGEIYIEDLFHGRLLLISDAALTFLAVTLTLCFLLATAFRRRVLLALTDPDFATVSGLKLTRWNVVLALLNGCVVGVAVATVGPLVTFGFLILPVLAVATFAKSLHTHLVWAMLFGVVMATIGFLISYRFDFPLGDSVVAIGCIGLAIMHAARAMF